jgi:fructokinase
MMAAIYRNGITVDQLDRMGEKEWSKVISMGVDFATNVCLSYENYISQEFALELRK